jgi:hypothetical protein
MKRRIEEETREPEYREKVQRLRALWGLARLTTLALVGEIGEFRRFPHAGGRV